jgi:hypothetical protein
MANKKENAVVEETTTAASAENVEVQTEVVVSDVTEEVVEAVTEEVENTEVTEEVVSFAVLGRKYRLSERCPAKVQFEGKVYAKSELLTNEDVLTALVVGESPFIKKL